MYELLSTVKGTAVPAEAPEAPMDVETALQKVLKNALIHDGLRRGGSQREFVSAIRHVDPVRKPGRSAAPGVIDLETPDLLIHIAQAQLWHVS